MNNLELHPSPAHTKPKHLEWDDIIRCSGSTLAIDTETNGLHWFKPDQHIIGVGIHCPEREVFGYRHLVDSTERNTFYKVIRELSPHTTAIFHNAKFDLHFMNVNPEEVGWKIYDTAILAHLYDSRVTHRKALASLEKRWLKTESKRNHVTTAPARKNIWEWPANVRFDYGYNDTLVTYDLFMKLAPQVMRLQLWPVFEKEMLYMNVIWKAERQGMLLDPEYLEISIDLQEQHWHQLEQELWDSIGYEFNWRSPKQLSKAIYNDMGIAKPKNPFADADGVDRSRFADAGLYKSTCTSSFLLNEKVHHPLGPLISALREAYRMWTTMKSYRELSDPSGRVHANFKQARTRTGRLSCGDPNLQNVPSLVRGRFTQSVFSGDTTRSGEYNLRKAYMAPPGYELLSVDWKQMEMRMFGILSEDPFMLDTLKAGKDVHAEVAKKVWGATNKTYREWSKTIGFGLIYGMTLGSLMFKLNKTRTEAKKIQDDYLAEFPRIMPWMNEVINTVKAQGYIRYWNGRIWREDDMTYAYRGANAQIQGGCAEILSVAAIRTDRYLQTSGYDARIVNFVHDELMMEVKATQVRDVAREVGKIMEVSDLFDIPFLTDGKSGPTYGSQEKLGEKLRYYETEEDLNLIH